MSRIGRVITREATGAPGERTVQLATRATSAAPRPQQTESASSTGSLLRGIRIIETLADAPSPLLLVELAERVHLDSSTVYRLVQSLAQEGFVVRLSSKRYVAGPRTLRLLGTYHPVNRFCRDVELVLQQLRDQVGETIMLVLFAGIERVIVKIVQGRESLSQSYETWLRTPLHGSASGKLLLMQTPLPRLRELLGAAALSRRHRVHGHHRGGAAANAGDCARQRLCRGARRCLRGHDRDRGADHLPSGRARLPDGRCQQRAALARERGSARRRAARLRDPDHQRRAVSARPRALPRHVGSRERAPGRDHGRRGREDGMQITLAAKDAIYAFEAQARRAPALRGPPRRGAHPVRVRDRYVRLLPGAPPGG